MVDLPHSDDAFVKAFPAETTEAFCEGHNAAFRYFGGVPRSILYDNTTLAVARILGDGRRKRTRVFSELQSHYLFSDRFGRRAKATTRERWKDWSVMPGETSWCRRQGFQAGKRSTSSSKRSASTIVSGAAAAHRTIEERFKRDRQALLPLPPTPYEPATKHHAGDVAVIGALSRQRLLGAHTLRTSPGVAERLRR